MLFIQKMDSKKVIITLIKINYEINIQLMTALKPYGISIQQFNVLRILRGQKGVAANLSTVQERMINKMSNTTRLIDKLIEKSFVERIICKENRRKIELFITNKGLVFLKQNMGILLNTVCVVYVREYAWCRYMCTTEAKILQSDAEPGARYLPSDTSTPMHVALACSVTSFPSWRSTPTLANAASNLRKVFLAREADVLVNTMMSSVATANAESCRRLRTRSSTMRWGESPTKRAKKAAVCGTSTPPPTRSAIWPLRSARTARTQRPRSSTRSAGLCAAA